VRDEVRVIAVHGPKASQKHRSLFKLSLALRFLETDMPSHFRAAFLYSNKIPPWGGYMSLKALIWAGSLVAAAAFGPVAQAAGPLTLYATGNDGSSLFTINSATGAATYVGDFGYLDTYSLAFSPNNQLYAVVDSYDSSTLATVNTTTGAATPVGAGTYISDLMAIVFAPNGTLYGASWGTNDLYTINPATGAATEVGALGFDNVMDLAFAPDGQLYAIGNGLYEINTSTGAGTQVDAEAGDGDLMGLTIGDGQFFVTDYSSSSPLYTLNPADGSVTLIGDTGIDYSMGLTYLGVASGVPEPASWALLILGVGFAGAEVRRRRPSATSRRSGPSSGAI
jgi:PEP-CTERM motif